MFKGSIGPGCLSLPFAVSTVGLWVAPGAMAVLMFCCVYNMFLMVKVKHELTARPATSFVQTYGDIGHVTFGPQGRRIVEIFVTLQQLGICTVYFSFASTNVRAFSLARSLSHTLTVVSAACRSPGGPIIHGRCYQSADSGVAQRSRRVRRLHRALSLTGGGVLSLSRVPGPDPLLEDPSPTVCARQRGKAILRL